MISMRYAKNLAEGYGLVWNPGGERVEGFTNPLWVGYMAIWHLTSLSPAKISLPIQITNAVFLFLNLFVVRALAKEVTKGEWLSLGAVFLTAFFFSLNNWALQGMEVGLLTLVVSLAVWQGLRSLRDKTFSIGLYLLLGISTLVRMDMAVAFLVMIAGLAWFDPTHRRKHLIWGIGILGVFLAAQFLLRYAYYGEWLPNTYYLKLGGVSLVTRVRTGFGAFRQFVWTTGWVLFVLPLMLFLMDANPRVLLLAGVVVGQIAYSIYVGGDAWEHRGGANRFIAIAMPQFFVLFVYALELVRRAIVITLPKIQKTAEAVTRASLPIFLLFSLFSFNTILANDSVAKWTLAKRPIFVDGTERITQIGLTLKEITLPGASIAVVSAGGTIYFSERNGVDLYGKMDKVIAHTKPRAPKGLVDFADTRPGHAKWDYAYSIGELQPDIIAQFVDETLDEARPYLGNYTRYEVNGFPFYIRNDSPYILWDEIP
jgi:hypothetical protein